MRKILFGVIITLVILFSFKYCGEQKEDKISLQESSALIKEHIKNVGKLIVTEGHFSEIFNYKNSKELFGSYITSEKNALVVVNASVTVAYDLSLIEYQIDEASKTLTLLNIPEVEVTINPDLEYYDVQSDFFNPFEAEDYNDIKETIHASLQEKINKTELITNSKNRLISELSKFLILTNSLGWTLQYNDANISKLEELQSLKF